MRSLVSVVVRCPLLFCTEQGGSCDHSVSLATPPLLASTVSRRPRLYHHQQFAARIFVMQPVGPIGDPAASRADDSAVFRFSPLSVCRRGFFSIAISLSYQRLRGFTASHLGPIGDPTASRPYFAADCEVVRLVKCTPERNAEQEWYKCTAKPSSSNYTARKRISSVKPTAKPSLRTVRFAC